MQRFQYQPIVVCVVYIIYAMKIERVNALDKYSLSELDKRLNFYSDKVLTHAIYDN